MDAPLLVNNAGVVLLCNCIMTALFLCPPITSTNTIIIIIIVYHLRPEIAAAAAALTAVAAADTHSSSRYQLTTQQTTTAYCSHWISKVHSRTCRTGLVMGNPVNTADTNGH